MDNVLKAFPLKLLLLTEYYSHAEKPGVALKKHSLEEEKKKRQMVVSVGAFHSWIQDESNIKQGSEGIIVFLFSVVDWSLMFQSQLTQTKSKSAQWMNVYVDQNNHSG